MRTFKSSLEKGQRRRVGYAELELREHELREGGLLLDEMNRVEWKEQSGTV